MTDPLLSLRNEVEGAAASLRDGDGLATPSLERPPKAELGDYSTNAAMLLAPALGEPPRDVAERLREELDGRLGASADRIEVAGPGFLNLFLTDRWYREGVAAVLGAGDEFGGGVVDAPQRIQVEFVSANPTGPLTAAGGRHAAYGDSVSRILGFAGHSVEREYYVNDTGGQMRRFAESIAARMSRADPPEDGYEGAYVEELARELAGAGVDAGDIDALERAGGDRMLEAARATLERFGVSYESWFSERSLYESGKVDAALDELRREGHIYDSEGAVWLRTTEFGDDKDRVLIRSDGEPTYFTSDVAYHRDKFERGFDRLLNVLGADHHGYVGRIRAALKALGYDADRFEALIMQLVHIVEGGERAQMSKRRGEFVTLDELLDDIGSDAARFLMLRRSHDTAVDLDLELARRQSQDNPVYYVQYAHARIASILRKAGEDATRSALASIDSSFQAMVEPSERALIKRLLELPGDVAMAAQARAPHRLCAYATATAADFHGFYRDCRVVGAESEDGAPPGTEAGRLALCVATKRVVARTLELLGVGAPDRM